MKSTITLAANMNTNPFEIFAQDVDEVIILINFYLRIGAESNNAARPEKTTRANAQQRIRVNDSTATGGWW